MKMTGGVGPQGNPNGFLYRHLVDLTELGAWGAGGTLFFAREHGRLAPLLVSTQQPGFPPNPALFSLTYPPLTYNKAERAGSWRIRSHLPITKR